MLLSAVSVLVVAQSSSEIPEGLMNNPVFVKNALVCLFLFICTFINWITKGEKLCVKLTLLETTFCFFPDNYEIF